MFINYDPDGKPDIPATVLEEANRLGLHPVLILCDEPGAQIGDPTGVSFVALVRFMPAQGDRIVLEDGRICEVNRIYYKVVPRRDSRGSTQSVLLVPNVTAYLLADKDAADAGDVESF